MSREDAVVLLSGGLDSATVLYLTRSKGFRVRCLVFDYDQRHRREIKAAQTLARLAQCPIQIIEIKLPWRGSSLLDKKMPLPEYRRTGGIPSTYVPARNTVFLSFALSYAEAIGAGHIFIGANALDYSGYPDCRPEFYSAFNKLARVATKRGVEHQAIKIHAPLIRLKKSQIIALGRRLHVPYEATWSCYKGGRRPCGRCDSCLLRAKGFREAHREDPLLNR